MMLTEIQLTVVQCNADGLIGPEFAACAAGGLNNGKSTR
jgi:hypothetical protein